MNLELLEALAARLAKKPSEFISSLYTDETQAELKPTTEIIPEIEKLVSEKIRTVGENQRNRGLKEGRKLFEKAIKSQFEPDDQTLEGLELWDAFNEHLEASKVSTPDTLTKEALAKMPEVKELIADGKKAALKKYSDLEHEFQDYKAGVKAEELKSKVEKQGVKLLTKNRVKFESDGLDTDKRLNAIFKQIDYSQLKVEGEEIIVLDSDGHPKEDDFGKAVTFESYLLDIGVPLYGVRKQDPDKGSPERDRKPGVTGGTEIVIRDESHFNELLSKTTGAVARTKLYQAWEDKQNNS